MHTDNMAVILPGSSDDIVKCSYHKTAVDVRKIQNGVNGFATEIKRTSPGVESMSAFLSEKSPL